MFNMILSQGYGGMHNSDRRTIRLSTIALHLAILSGFTGAVSTLVGPALALSASILLIISGSRRVSKRLLAVVGLVLANGVLNIAIGHTSVANFLSTFLSTTAYFLAFYFLICQSRFPLAYIFKVYIGYATVVAAIGLLQAGCWQIGVQACYDYRWIIPGAHFVPGSLFGLRVSSILYEPSQVAFTMGPAIAACILQFVSAKDRFIGVFPRLLILVFTVLSQSSTAYVLVLLTFFAAIFQIRKNIIARSVFVSAVLTAIAIVVTAPPFVKPSIAKAQSLVQLAQQGQLAAHNASSTTYTLYSNARLAMSHAANTFFLGGGMGSHAIYFKNHVTENSHQPLVRNKTGAGNLVFRLLSEFGIPGLMMLGLVIFTGIKRIKRAERVDKLILTAMLLGIFAFCIRNGTYAHYGLAFYIVALLWGGTVRRRQQQNVESAGMSQLQRL